MRTCMGSRVRAYVRACLRACVRQSALRRFTSSSFSPRQRASRDRVYFSPPVDSLFSQSNAIHSSFLLFTSVIICRRVSEADYRVLVIWSIENEPRTRTRTTRGPRLARANYSSRVLFNSDALRFSGTRRDSSSNTRQPPNNRA